MTLFPVLLDAVPPIPGVHPRKELIPIQFSDAWKTWTILFHQSSRGLREVVLDLGARESRAARLKPEFKLCYINKFNSITPTVKSSTESSGRCLYSTLDLHLAQKEVAISKDELPLLSYSVVLITRVRSSIASPTLLVLFSQASRRRVRPSPS